MNWSSRTCRVDDCRGAGKNTAGAFTPAAPSLSDHSLTIYRDPSGGLLRERIDIAGAMSTFMR